MVYISLCILFQNNLICHIREGTAQNIGQTKHQISLMKNELNNFGKIFITKYRTKNAKIYRVISCYLMF